MCSERTFNELDAELRKSVFVGDRRDISCFDGVQKGEGWKLSADATSWLSRVYSFFESFDLAPASFC